MGHGMHAQQQPGHPQQQQYGQQPQVTYIVPSSSADGGSPWAQPAQDANGAAQTMAQMVQQQPDGSTAPILLPGAPHDPGSLLAPQQQAQQQHQQQQPGPSYVQVQGPNGMMFVQTQP